ncbi:hypothetical protein HRI_003579400 [Hibiscus trionum]|uniref:Pollen Ole e 1 allergen and extensin family protein n=1 Tax=Hibiscus trionum TaxID=183268 RepID=A0A9W7IQ37_HIBTR|nr:hypothetical protein HRI_003579400 [Hibiscus trionum]
MSGFLLTLLLTFFIFNGSSEGSHEPAVVVGTVYCDTCFHQDFPKATHFISGATVAVECRYGKSSRPSFRQQVKTNKNGEFRVDLPFSVSKHVKKIRGCWVKLIKSSEPYCAVASSAASSSPLHFKSRKQGTHIFSAGFFTFKPFKQPFLCNQKPSVDGFKQPLNKLPSSVHPNQFLPPPIVLPPNPFQPPNPLQPPSAPLVPNPLQPPPAPLTPSLPPVPGLTPPPSPPSTPSPEFPFPLPPPLPLPFPPIPPFPGVPPAKSSP